MTPLCSCLLTGEAGILSIRRVSTNHARARPRHSHPHHCPVNTWPPSWPCRPWRTPVTPPALTRTDDVHPPAFLRVWAARKRSDTVGEVLKAMRAAKREMRVGASGRYPFQTFWSACHPATWSTRSGPAERQPLAPWRARACDQAPGVRREPRRSGPGVGRDPPRPLAAACAQLEADPDWLSGGPARRG